MSEPPRLFFTGNSLEQAVLMAAQHYGCEPDDLAYERVERRYGFLRVRRNVVIKVDPKNPVRKRRGGRDAGPPQVLVETEVDDTPQLETQHDFNLHRDPPRTAAPERPGRPGQRAGHQQGSGGQRGQGRGGQRGQGQAGVRDQGPPRAAGPRGQQGAGRPGGGFDRSRHGRDPSRETGRPGEGGGEERGGRRRRRRRGGGSHPGGDRAPAAPALDFVPEPRDLPRAEGETAELAGATARQLVALAGLDVEVEVFQGETELEVELHGTDQERLFEDEGRLLLAIQHLLPRSMQGEAGESAGVRVDSQGFRSQRVASLERMARDAAEEVRRRGRPKTLHSMNPSDRRTVHLALKDAEGVVTESNGDGFYKRITVRPA
jgi:spoIIIJ-associated protein